MSAPASPPAPIAVTFFGDPAAASKREQVLDLAKLAKLIETTTGPAKGTLPWLKLARFGDVRSAKGSLRHDANLLAISGVEADYDAAIMGVDEAVERLGAAGILAIVYTSPSHTADTPRWRVLCPLSTEYLPEHRERFLARLNGLFGGAFAGESWTRSQSYYYGSVNRNPSHRVELLDGTPIDLVDELDMFAMGKPEKPGKANGANGAYHGPATPPEAITDKRMAALFQSLLDNISAAQLHEKHTALWNNGLAIGGRLHLSNWSDGDAIEACMAALAKCNSEVESWPDARKTAAEAIAAGRLRPMPLEDRPGRTSRRPIPPPAPEPATAPETETKTPGREDDLGPPEPIPSSDDAEAAWRGTDPDAPQHPGATPTPDDYPEPVDFMAAQWGAPNLKEHHVPQSLWPFILDNAERMGVATSSVALCAIVSCSAAINEEWKIQPKRRDWDWLEAARLWGAIVGPPSVLKSPVIALTTKPIEMLDIKAMEEWNAQQIAHKAWKDAADDTVTEPETPPRSRYLVESATVEALSEVLRDDTGGKLRAPLGKVLVRQDELEEFLANMDKYSTTNKGTDRGAWTRAYNGGRHIIDRIGRGSFAVKSWSCCLLGGVQPDVIREIAKRMTDNGLIQRLALDVPGPQVPGLDRAPNITARDLYRALFPALAALHPGRNRDDYIEPVTLHADAHEAREDIERLARVMQAMPDASSRLASTFGKWPGLFARLCLTFHLIEAAASRVRNPGGLHPVLHVVTAETADRVRRYMRAVLMPCLLRAETLMFGTTQTEHATWIAQHILIHHLDRISARDITRAYGALRAPEERDTLYSVMDSLCLFGWAEPVESRNPTRPTAWWINPRVHALYSERTETERKRRAEVAETIARERAAYRETSD